VPGVLGEQDSRHGCEFNHFFSCADGATPQRLLQRGVYSHVAVALKGGAWRETSMALVGKALGLSKDEVRTAKEGKDVLGQGLASFDEAHGTAWLGQRSTRSRTSSTRATEIRRSRVWRSVLGRTWHDMRSRSRFDLRSTSRMESRSRHRHRITAERLQGEHAERERSVQRGVVQDASSVVAGGTIDSGRPSDASVTVTVPDPIRSILGNVSSHSAEADDDISGSEENRRSNAETLSGAGDGRGLAVGGEEDLWWNRGGVDELSTTARDISFDL